MHPNILLLLVPFHFIPIHLKGGLDFQTPTVAWADISALQFKIDKWTNNRYIFSKC